MYLCVYIVSPCIWVCLNIGTMMEHEALLHWNRGLAAILFFSKPSVCAGLETWCKVYGYPCQSGNPDLHP